MNRAKFKRLAEKSLELEVEEEKMGEEKLEQFKIEAIGLDSYKDVPELSEFDYLLVPLDSVERIIRENGLSSDGCDEICIKEDAPIMFVKKGQKL